MRFVYAEEPEGKGERQTANGEEDAPFENVLSLPSEWREHVKYAAKIADFTQLARLIDAIRPQHALFAAQLSKYLENFEYTAVIKLIQEDQDAASRDPAFDRPDPVTPEALAALPGAWRLEFRHAVKCLDVEQTQTLIEQIRGCNALLADTLTELVRQYRFDRILDYVERSNRGNLS